MVGLRELESLTSCVSSRRSNQLSYRPEWEPSFDSKPLPEFPKLSGLPKSRKKAPTVAKP
jgi:hypothetical protein